MKGEPNLEATYNGALYRFVSPMNRETFEKNPAKYAPAYGGLLRLCRQHRQGPDPRTRCCGP